MAISRHLLIHLPPQDRALERQNAIASAGDLADRYGGEELAIVLPNTDATGALHIARTIHRTIEELQLPHPRSVVSPHLTLSLEGRNVVADGGHSTRSGDPIALADPQLDRAKQQGRNGYGLPRQSDRSLDPGNNCTQLDLR